MVNLPYWKLNENRALNSTHSIGSIIISFLACKNSFAKVFIPPSLCSFLQLNLVPHGPYSRQTSALAEPGCSSHGHAQRLSAHSWQLAEYTANILCRSYCQQILGGSWAVLKLPGAQVCRGLGAGREGRKTPFVWAFGSLVPTRSLHFPRCLSSKER